MLPEKRITAEEALTHPFFSLDGPDTERQQWTEDEPPIMWRKFYYSNTKKQRYIQP